MGWSWPWRRSNEAPAADPPASAAPSSSWAPSQPPPSPMGWAFLPPIQRQLAEPIRPLSRGFEPAAWTSPVFTGDMTHAVAEAAPQGLIDGDGRGLGTPLQRSVQGPELTLLPPPRPRAERTVQRVAQEPAGDDRPMEAPEPAGPAAPEPAGPAAPEPAGPAASDPVRSLTRAAPTGLPVVQRAAIAAPAPPAGPLASVAPITPVTPDAPMSESPGPDDAAPSTPLDDPDHTVALLGDRTPDLLPSDAELPGPPVASPADPQPPLTSPHVAAPLQRAVTPQGGQVAGERPRLGLGPPLSHVPPSAVGSPPPESGGAAGPLAGAGVDGFTEVALPAPPPRPPGALPLQRAATPEAEAPATPAGHADPALPAASEDVPHTGHPAAVLPEEAVAPEPVAVSLSPLLLPDAAPLHATGLSTSIQRSSVLPGPGLPMPALSVRPAGAPTPARGRMVRLQRTSSATPSLPAAYPAATAPRSTVSTPSSTSIPSSFPTSASGGIEMPTLQRSTTSAATRTPAGGQAPSAPGSVDAAPGDPSAPPDSTTTLATVVPAALPGPDALGDPVPLQRMADAATRAAPSHGAPAALATRVALVTPAATVATVATAPASVAPSTPVAVVQRVALPAAPPAAPSAAASATAQRSVPSLAPALARLADPPSAAEPSAAPALALPHRPAAAEVAQRAPAVVQRADAPMPDAGPEPPPAAPDPPTPAAPGATSTTATTAAAPAAASGAAAAAAQTPEQTDALARQLFPPMLRMLRQELVTDRERRGIRSDRW